MPTTSFAATSLMQLGIVAEDAPGTTPAAPLQLLRITSQGLNQATTYATSQEIRADRQVPDHIRTDRSVGGEISFEFSAGSFDDLIAAVFQGTWSTPHAVTGTDIAATAATNRLTSTTTNFTTLSLVPGQWIRIAGMAAPENAGYARVVAIAAHTLTLDHITLVNEAAGASVTIAASSLLRNGTAARSFTLERQHTDIGQFFAFRGAVPDTLSLSLDIGQIMQGSIGFRALSAERAEDSAGTGSPIPPGSTAPFDAVASIAKLTQGGVSTGARIRNLSFNFGNASRDQKTIGTLGPAGIASGAFSATLQVKAYFQDAGLYDLYQAGEETSLAVAVEDAAGNAYVLSLPAVKLDRAQVVAGRINQDVILDISARAKIDGLSGVMAQIDRFA